MIVTGGEKVYPVEVERLLRALPGVADVALVGVPDPEWGEFVLACVVRDARPGRGGLTRGGGAGATSAPGWPATSAPATWSSSTPCR